jgi:hypothetical protein
MDSQTSIGLLVLTSVLATIIVGKHVQKCSVHCNALLGLVILYRCTCTRGHGNSVQAWQRADRIIVISHAGALNRDWPQ